jgi:hypothetical protein
LKHKNLEGWTEREIVKITVHPEFNRYLDAAYNDVAILKLAKGVEFTKNVRPICLPEAPSDDPDHLSGKAVSVSGWGKINNQAPRPSDTLKTAHIRVYEQRY